jgi:hypothetical protein
MKKWPNGSIKETTCVLCRTNEMTNEVLVRLPPWELLIFPPSLGGELPADMLTFLQQGETALARAKETVAKRSVRDPTA